MTNTQIASVLDEVADLLEFQGANPFRVRAYRNASRALSNLSTAVTAILADPTQRLTDVPGVGQDLADKVATLVQTGHLPLLDELHQQVPAGVLALLRVPGLGPKKAATLHRELKVNSLDDLRAACQAHQVRELKGFGTKTEETILAGLDLAATAGDRIYWAAADEVVQELLAFLRGGTHLDELTAAGSYRRGKESVGDLDLLATSTKPDAVMDRLAAFPDIEQVLARGDTKMSVRLVRGLQVDLRVVPPESYGAALQYFTGSKEHNVVLRARAKELGLKVNEYGVFRGEEQIAGRTEDEFYQVLGLPWIPPELREARHEFEWAESGHLPKLIEVDDLHGDLHMHTDATDGAATLEEMCVAAQARGLKYIAITDHSQRVTMANGLNPDRLRRQWDQIERLRPQFKGLHVLKGIEVDILERGGLDLPDDVLAEADWVVASVHYGQNQPRAEITKRIVDALAHPSVSAIAHPTGRLINRRKPYEVDLEAVFAAAKAHGKFLELNANPARLDLDDVACAAAKRQGIPLVISTDAHSVEGLAVLRYGVLQARRAGLTKDDVLNTRGWAQFHKLLGRGK